MDNQLLKDVIYLLNNCDEGLRHLYYKSLAVLEEGYTDTEEGLVDHVQEVSVIEERFPRLTYTAETQAVKELTERSGFTAFASSWKSGITHNKTSGFDVELPLYLPLLSQVVTVYTANCIEEDKDCELEMLLETVSETSCLKIEKNDCWAYWKIHFKQPKQKTVPNCQIRKKPKMSKIEKVAKSALEDNKSAALYAAQLTAGKAANKLAVKAIKPQLPMMVRGYADSAFGPLIIANLANLAVTSFVDDPRAKLITEAMLKAAMVEVLDELDIESFIDSFMSSVPKTKLDKLVKAAEEAEEE